MQTQKAQIFAGLTALSIVLTAATSFSAARSAAKRCSEFFTSQTDFKQSLQYLTGTNKAWMDDNKCLSCHTTLVLAMVGNPDTNRQLQRMRGRIVERTTNWENSLANPWAGYDPASVRSTESVLNALSLVMMDSNTSRGTPKLSPEAELALNNMLAQQIKRGDAKGSYRWLDMFRGFAPFEDPGAGYWGTSAAALAIGLAPDGYANRPEVKKKLNVLKDYLVSGFGDTILHHKIMSIWASSTLGDFLPRQSVEKTRRTLLSLQKEDGGWVSLDLNSREMRGRRRPSPDAYATAISIIGLLKTGDRSPETLTAVTKGVRWLLANKKPDGHWDGYSYHHDGPSPFFADVGTGYAVLALKMAPSEVSPERRSWMGNLIESLGVSRFLDPFHS